MEGNYEVGYKSPPQGSQFKKGQSGNRNGRPKGTKNLKTDLQEELQEQIRVREGDRAITISKQRAIVKTLVAKTLKGDNRAASTLLGAMFRVLDRDEPLADPDQTLNKDESAALALLQERLLGKANAPPDTVNPEVAGGVS